MMPLLAQSAAADPVSHAFVGQWILTAGIILSIAMQAHAMFRGGKPQQRQIVDQPLKVEGTPKFALHAELETKFGELSKRLGKVEEAIERDYRQLSERGQERAELLVTKLDEVKSDVLQKIDDSLKDAYSRINGHGERIAALEARIDD